MLFVLVFLHFSSLNALAPLLRVQTKVPFFQNKIQS